SSILVTAVLVPAQPSQRLIVAFGDSVTDGDGSTPDADRDWPSDLVHRLEKMSGGSKVAVVNEGIAGNRLLRDGFAVGAGFAVDFGVSALARFDRDVLALPGVTHVMLLGNGHLLCGQPQADFLDRAPASLRTVLRHRG